jgi:hypothetical protein
VEKAYQQTKDFDRYKLSKMLKIAEASDPTSRFHNALYAGDIQGRIAVLREVGLRECLSKALILLSSCNSHRTIGLCHREN